MRVRVVVAVLGGVLAALASSRGQSGAPQTGATVRGDAIDSLGLGGIFMSAHTRIRSAIASLAIAASARAAAQTSRGVIDGVVSDTNLVALGGATVSILGSDVKVSTGDNGRFRITGLRSGNYILAVHRIGYVPVAVAVALAEQDTLRPSFALRRVVTALDTMIVTAKSAVARLEEFERRRSMGDGHFITTADMERRGSVYVADIIRVVPSVGIQDKRDGSQVAFNLRPNSHGCPFQLFLDGIQMPSGTDLSKLPPPKDLAGIEIYSGPATAPLQYSFGDTSCGVILLWTKSGE